MKLVITVLLTICVLLTLGMTHIGGANTYQMDATDDYVFVLDSRTGVVRVFSVAAMKDGTFNAFTGDERILRDWKRIRD